MLTGSTQYDSPKNFLLHNLNSLKQSYFISHLTAAFGVVHVIRTRASRRCKFSSSTSGDLEEWKRSRRESTASLCSRKCKNRHAYDGVLRENHGLALSWLQIPVAHRRDKEKSSNRTRLSSRRKKYRKGLKVDNFPNFNSASFFHQVRTHFRNVKWLKIPRIHWELSTNRVLVMEYCEGGQVNDLEYLKKNNIDPFDVSNKLGILYANMIFLNGWVDLLSWCQESPDKWLFEISCSYVHSDPHPGNILVHKNKSGGTDIVLLDHGLYAVSFSIHSQLVFESSSIVLF